jgi:hypothetical protein
VEKDHTGAILPWQGQFQINPEARLIMYAIAWWTAYSTATLNELHIHPMDEQLRRLTT